MSAGAVYVRMAYGVRVLVVSPLSILVLVYKGLFSVVAAAMVVGGTSEGGSVATISGI